MKFVDGDDDNDDDDYSTLVFGTIMIYRHFIVLIVPIVHVVFLPCLILHSIFCTG